MQCSRRWCFARAARSPPTSSPTPSGATTCPRRGRSSCRHPSAGCATAIGRNAIATSPGAYTLRIDPDTVDAERFERLAASARRHLDDDPARAADAADRALALWRGVPYADLASWPPALVESERLDEVRMELEEVRVDGAPAARRARGIGRRR